MSQSQRRVVMSADFGDFSIKLQTPQMYGTLMLLKNANQKFEVTLRNNTKKTIVFEAVRFIWGDEERELECPLNLPKTQEIRKPIILPVSMYKAENREYDIECVLSDLPNPKGRVVRQTVTAKALVVD